jgi:hypothetical protein
MKWLYCETCDAPLPAVQGRGQPRRYCSLACKQAAHRQRRVVVCEHCGKAMNPNGRFCSDRCFYYGHGGIVPFDKLNLAAFDEVLIPVYPRGYIPPSKPWHGWVYGGAERPGGYEHV